jgi:hypothetical protein
MSTRRTENGPRPNSLVGEHGLRAKPRGRATPVPGVAGGCRERSFAVGSPPGFTLPLSGTAEAHSTAGTLTASLLPAFVARPRRANQPFAAIFLTAARRLLHVPKHRAPAAHRLRRGRVQSSRMHQALPHAAALGALPLDAAPFAVVDVETTGFKPGLDRIVEIAVFHVHGADAYVAFESVVNPDQPVGASEVHGLTDECVSKAPRFHEIAGELLRSLCQHVIVGHNVAFDLRFLVAEFDHVGVHVQAPWIDSTCSLCRS